VMPTSRGVRRRAEPSADVRSERKVGSVMWIRPFCWNLTSTFFLVGDQSPGQSVTIRAPLAG
jgi:hypothetical protein